MLLNLDVWHEIISYLEYPQDKITLRALALTSSTHSHLALDVIWQDGKTVLKVVSVINWFATSPKEPLLQYGYKTEDNQEEKSGDGSRHVPPRGRVWVLNGPIPNASRKRALEYLARIRRLKVPLSWVAQKEESLWPVLSDCLGSPGPLLPYLQCLEVGRASKDRLDCLTPLLSPSIKILKIRTGLIPEHKLMVPLLELTKAHGCDLQVLAYKGGQIQRVPEIAALFKNLQDIQFPPNYPLQKGSSITIVEFLASLPSLRSLACNLGVFSRCAMEDNFCHNSLRRMDITSTAIILQELFHCCIFPSVTEVKISKNGFKVLGFEGLDSCFPNTQKLDIDVHPIINADNIPALKSEHFVPLLSLPMQEFKLRVAKLHLTPANFGTISRSWPNLSSFQVWSANKLESDVLSSLSGFSGHPHLKHLDLDIRPCHLLDDVTKVPDLTAVHTPSRNSSIDPCSLYFATAGRGLRETRETTRAEKRVVVEFLLLLFPNLGGLGSKHHPRTHIDPDAEILAELKEILLEVWKERGSEDPSI